MPSHGFAELVTLKFENPSPPHGMGGGVKGGWGGWGYLFGQTTDSGKQFEYHYEPEVSNSNV